MILLLLAMCFGAWFVWRKSKSLTKDLDSVQEQLGDHYEYAAWLCERLDTIGWMMDEGNSMSERMNNLHGRFAVFEEDIREGLNTLGDATDCIRYGLVTCERNSFISYAAQSDVHSGASQLCDLETQAEHGGHNRRAPRRYS